MPTQLDKDISRITQAVTAPGQMLELIETTRRGVTMPAFKNAPPATHREALVRFYGRCDPSKLENVDTPVQILQSTPGSD